MKRTKTDVNYDILKQINDICLTVENINNYDLEGFKNIFKQVAIMYLQSNFAVAPLLRNKILNNYIFLNTDLTQIVNKEDVKLIKAYKEEMVRYEKLKIYDMYKLKSNIIDINFFTYLINKHKYIEFMEKNLDKFDWFNIALLFVSKSDIVVFDTDNDKTTELFMSFKEFRDTLKVKTKKGYHFYFQITDPDNIPKDFTDLVFYRDFSDYSVDIRSQSGYTILPPSKVYNHIYQWEINEIVKLKWNDMQKLMNRIKTYCFLKIYNQQQLVLDSTKPSNLLMKASKLN